MKVTIRSTFAVGSTSHMGPTSSDRSELCLKLRSGITVSKLLKALPSIGSPEQFDDIMIHVFVNGELKGFDYVLGSGDVIDIHIPVSGG